MTLREAKRLKPGAIVRESWNLAAVRTGLVITKEHIKERHHAKVLCSQRDERYDIFVHWFEGPRMSQDVWGTMASNPEKVQNWELMVVSHV